MQVRHFLMRVGAMVGQHPVALILHPQLPRHRAHGAQEACELGVVEGGYRVLSNHGEAANQEVPHLHVHLFAGAPLGPMLKKVAA